MKTIWQARLVDTTTKLGELAPTATVCCNTCRACVQTNAIAAFIAGLGAAGTLITRRLPRRSRIG